MNTGHSALSGQLCYPREVNVNLHPSLDALASPFSPSAASDVRFPLHIQKQSGPRSKAIGAQGFAHGCERASPQKSPQSCLGKSGDFSPPIKKERGAVPLSGALYRKAVQLLAFVTQAALRGTLVRSRSRVSITRSAIDALRAR